MNTFSAVGIPVIVIIIASIWNQYSLNEFRKEADKRLERIEARLQQLGDEVHEVKGRLDEIRKHA